MFKSYSKGSNGGSHVSDRSLMVAPVHVDRKSVGGARIRIRVGWLVAFLPFSFL